jgi:WD40-like Beta Propeller Repeat
MKKPIVIVLFSCIITALMTSGTAGKEAGSVFLCNSACGIEYDTTYYIGHLKVDPFNLTILPPSSGVQFYKNGIVFLSLAKKEVKMLPDQLSFGAIEAYYAVPEDSVLGNHMVFSPGTSFPYPCESITFSNDFKSMYFTKLSENDNKEKIYMAKFTPIGKKHQGWQSELHPLDFCTDNTSYSHPALSAGGNIMIFASDTKGSFGGMDLFISYEIGEKWSSAENLGNLINTTGNEFFPFLDSDNNLFFSSDGLPGYGGYDIFTCKFNGKDWNKPINLSSRINSANDDIAFTINKTDGKTAFFTRRKKAEKWEMQLFRVYLDKEVTDNNLLTISNIFNDNRAIIPVSTELKIAAIAKPVKEEPAKAEKPIIPDETKAPPIENIPVKPKNPVITEDAVKTVPVSSPVNNDIVIYRVQFLASVTQKGKYQIEVNNKSYDTYEYYYKQAYRYTIGEFNTLAPAVELQNICRKSGYSEAFVVAFKNSVRSLDIALFK